MGEVFAPSSFWSDVVGGFMGRQREEEERNFKLAQQATEREQKIFGALLDSADPEIQALALTGLLDSAQPKKRMKGIRGWLGELQSSPILGEIQRTMQTPVAHTVQEPRQTLPSRQSAAGVGLPAVQPTIAEPAGDQPAAMPATALTEQKGQAPPTPLSYTQAPPTPYTVARTFMGPRKIFLTGADKVYQDTVARKMAEIEGARRGLEMTDYSPEAQQEILRGIIDRQYGRGGAAGQTYAEGEITPDASSPTGYIQTLYLRADPTKTIKMPAAPPAYATRSFGTELEPLAQSVFGKRGYQLSQQEAGVLLEAQTLRKGQMTPQQAIAAANRMLPNATVAQQFALAEYMRQATQAPVTPQTVTPATPTTPTEPATATTPTGTTPSAAPPRPTLGQGLDPKLAGATAERTTAGPDVSELAKMAAANPSVLQGGGVTPTVRGAVLNAIAKDPQLRRQYEQARMEPVRAQAKTVLSTLNDLIEVDSLGNVTGLTPGARDIFGMNPTSLIGRTIGYLPGTRAATSKAALDNVTGNLTLNLIRTMKEQSSTGATGFGQLSSRELDVLESSATMLKGGVTEARALQELTTLYDRFGKVLQLGAGEQDGPPAPESIIPEDLRTAPNSSVWEDAQGVPRWKKLANGEIVPYDDKKK